MKRAMCTLGLTLAFFGVFLLSALEISPCPSSPIVFGGKKLPSWLNSDYSPVFNKVNQYAQIDTTQYLPSGSSARTVMAWIFDYNPNIAYTKVPVFYGHPGNPAQGVGMALDNSDSNFGFVCQSTMVTQPAVRPMGWHHYAMTLPEGGTLGSWTFYVDGTGLTGAKTYSAGNANTAINTVLNTVMIGKWSIYPINAKIAEFSIWNRQLSQSEIQRYKDKRLKGTENGLVALYHMNEGPGNASQTLVDSVGGKNATCYNAVQWTKRNGYQAPDIRAASMALSFDGVDDYASATAANLPATASARTMMGWVFDANPSSTGFNCLFCYGANLSQYRDFGLFFQGTGTLSLELNSCGVRIPFTRTASWHHYAVVCPNAWTLSSATFFIDGVAQSGTRTYTAGGTPNTVPDTQVLKAHAAVWTDGTSGWMKGKIVDWSIWNRALSQSEIQQYMYQSLTGSETGLVRYYKFNEGTGTTIKDYASGHYDATAYNSPTWVGRDIP